MEAYTKDKFLMVIDMDKVLLHPQIMVQNILEIGLWESIKEKEKYFIKIKDSIKENLWRIKSMEKE